MKHVLLLALGLMTLFDSSSAFAANATSLAVTVAKQAGISEDQAKTQIDQVFSALKQEMIAGRAVTVTNFGRFYVQNRDARVGRNPRTGAALQIPAKRYPRFTSADRFKSDMNEGVAKAETAKPTSDSAQTAMTQ